MSISSYMDTRPPIEDTVTQKDMYYELAPDKSIIRYVFSVCGITQCPLVYAIGWRLEISSRRRSMR